VKNWIVKKAEQLAIDCFDRYWENITYRLTALEKESILTAQKIDSIRCVTDPEYRKLKDSLKEHLTAPDPNSDLYKL
jgi:hypothetical protein